MVSWVPLQNFWTTQRLGQITVALPTNYTQFRLVRTGIAPGNAFTRLATSYGKISTVAGRGLVPPGVNAWQTNYEGDYATNVFLSDPRNAVADDAGNIYVVEREGHAVDKISPDGKYMAFRKPWNETMNIWVKGVAEPFAQAKRLTAETKRPDGTLRS